MTEKAALTRKENTLQRYQIIKQDFNDIYSTRVDGIKLDLDGVIDRVAEKHGYSAETVKKILKK